MAPALGCVSPTARPRNKLRKLSKRRPESIAPSSVTPRDSTDSSRRASAETHGKPVPKASSQRASLPAPPDLSDPKWQEYVRKSGLSLQPMDKSPRFKHTKSPASSSSLIPEFAHLAVAPTPSPAPSKTSFEGPLPPTPPSPQSTLSTSSSIMRRYAKTPVWRIGQLEGEISPTKLDSDAESMAEQYRALLDARSYENLQAQSNTTLEEDMDEWHAAKTRQNTLETIRSALSRRSPLPPPPPIKAPPPVSLQSYSRQLTPPVLDPELEGGSPTSDGTLVDFEEDAAIYFKPSFSPEALSPIPEDDDGFSSSPNNPLRSPPPRPDALSLQITMELLSRELAGTLRRNNRRPQRGGGGGYAAAKTEIPPLQTWLMIEAYEKLRDQVLEMHLPVTQAHALQDMFDVWLNALYRVHEGLADESDHENVKEIHPPSELEVESLQTVDLD